MAAACSNSDAKVSAKDLQDLAQVSSPAFMTGLEYVMRAYPIVFGSQPGARPADAVKRILDKWMRHDSNFSRLTEFYQGETKPTIFWFFKLAILPQLVEWVATDFWGFLCGKVEPANLMRLDTRLSERELLKTTFHQAMNMYIQRMRDSPAPAIVVPQTPVQQQGAPAGGQAQPGAPKKQCSYCVGLGHVPPKTNHAFASCSGAQKELRKQNGKGDKNGGKGKGGKGKGGKGRGQNKRRRGNNWGGDDWSFSQHHDQAREQSWIPPWTPEQHQIQWPPPPWQPPQLDTGKGKGKAHASKGKGGGQPQGTPPGMGWGQY